MARLSGVMLGAALAAVTFGVTAQAAEIDRGTSLSNSNIVIAADDAAPDAAQAAPAAEGAQGSGKMGEESGTHTGPNQGSPPENDTDKVDQPARRDPTTGGAGDNAPGQ
jgi:hypothetical protein